MRNYLLKAFLLSIILIFNISCDQQNDDTSVFEKIIMAVSPNKKEIQKPSKEIHGLNKVTVGLAWDNDQSNSEESDLDVSAILVKADGKVRSDDDFCFYNNKSIINGAVQYSIDNKTGKGAGDNESINVELSKIPSELDKVIFTVTFHRAKEYKRNFGQVIHAYIHINNQDTGKEIARYYLSTDAVTDSAMIFGELYRNGAEWEFRQLIQGFTDADLATILKPFGIDASYSEN